MATRRSTRSGPLDAVAPASATVSATMVRLRAGFLALITLYGFARVRNPEYWDPLDDLNLAIHEAGHMVFSAFGEMATILGGSLFQVLVPVVFVGYFLRTRQRYAAAATLSWVGVNFLNVARYIGDARAQELPLLGGEDSLHDWWYLLINWDLLPHDLTIARCVHLLGVVAFIGSVVGGVGVIKHKGAEKNGATFRTARSAERRDVPNGARFQTARRSERRQVPNGATSQTALDSDG